MKKRSKCLVPKTLNIWSMQSKEFSMASIMDKLIAVGLIVSAAVTLWAVLTPNHLFVG